MFPEHTEYPPAGMAASMAYKSRHQHQVQLHTKNKNNQIESGHFHKQVQSYVCGLEHFLQPAECIARTISVLNKIGLIAIRFTPPSLQFRFRFFWNNIKIIQ